MNWETIKQDTWLLYKNCLESSERVKTLIEWEHDKAKKEEMRMVLSALETCIQWSKLAHDHSLKVERVEEKSLWENLLNMIRRR